MTDAADRILYLLKSHGAGTAARIGAALGMTATGARQHLARLRSRGLVADQNRNEGPGRPKKHWSLTDAGHARFPDSHSVLTVELLDAAGAVFGAEGLDRLIAHREAAGLALYRRRLDGCRTLAEKVAALAAARDREGYMADWRPDGDGFLLVENHCPICAAAAACRALCRSELAIFRTVLGPAATVERLEHIVSGARRCAYRIAPIRQ